MPDPVPDSPHGIPAALFLIFSFFGYVAAIGILDAVLIRWFGVDYSMTYGIRWMWNHEPIVLFVVVLGLGLLIGGLAMHFTAGHFEQ